MSIEVIIADSGPLIALARIRHLHLLPAIFGRVVIPAAVLRELTEGAAEGRVGAEDVRSAGWIDVRDADPELSAAFSLIVDRGESEAIALAVRAPSSLPCLSGYHPRKWVGECRRLCDPRRGASEPGWRPRTSAGAVRRWQPHPARTPRPLAATRRPTATSAHCEPVERPLSPAGPSGR